LQACRTARGEAGWRSSTEVHPAAEDRHEFRATADGARRIASLRRIRAEGFDFEVIDAHYYYPDGVAATMLGQWLNRPVTVTARGTDISLIPNYRFPRAQIRWAAGRASASIAVCDALRNEMRDLGLDEGKLRVLRQRGGLAAVPAMDRAEARARLGLPAGKWLLSVGHLIERKSHDIRFVHCVSCRIGR